MRLDDGNGAAVAVEGGILSEADGKLIEAAPELARELLAAREEYERLSDTLYRVTNLKLLETSSEAFLNRFLLREDKLVCLAVCIEDTNLKGLVDKGVETLKNLVLVVAAYARVVFSRKL